MAKLRAWVPPTALAVDLVDLVQRAERKVIEELALELRRDSLASAISAMPRIRAVLDRWLSGSMINDVVSSTGGRARSRADSHWADQVSNALGQSIAMDTRPSREIVQGWIAENTARIQGLRNETLARLQSDLETAVLSGTRAEELAAAWERGGLPTRNGTLRGRATVIARDQLGTLAGQLAESQQRALGITEYTWDDRPAVSREQRPVHRGRRGAVYGWDAAPPGGHPGRAINCMCGAVAVIPAARLREFEAGTLNAA